jgi:hypothetical protein
LARTVWLHRAGPLSAFRLNGYNLSTGKTTLLPLFSTVLIRPNSPPVSIIDAACCCACQSVDNPS